MSRVAAAPVADGDPEALLHLCDVDALIHELTDRGNVRSLRRLGVTIQTPMRLAALRARIAAGVDARWLAVYDRAHTRYGRGLAAVRERVCMGCFLTLPATARRPAGGEQVVLTCQGCGRLLFWG
jgi:predicted  nucleic acid-binding Zn-ribbon protein